MSVFFFVKKKFYLEYGSEVLFYLSMMPLENTSLLGQTSVQGSAKKTKERFIQEAVDAVKSRINDLNMSTENTSNIEISKLIEEYWNEQETFVLNLAEEKKEIKEEILRKLTSTSLSDLREKVTETGSSLPWKAIERRKDAPMRAKWLTGIAGWWLTVKAIRSWRDRMFWEKEEKKVEKKKWEKNESEKKEVEKEERKTGAEEEKETDKEVESKTWSDIAKAFILSLIQKKAAK